jgi:hypothetical protein
MEHAGADIADMYNNAGKLEIFQKLLSCGAASLDCKGQDTTGSFGKVFLCKLIVFISFESGIVYPVDFRMTFEEFCQSQSIMSCTTFSASSSDTHWQA